MVKIILSLIALLVLSLNAFPNYYAYLKTPAGSVFSGQASWFDPWDINVYTEAISQGQAGQVFLQNSYTSTPHQPLLYYPLYTLSGRLFPALNSFTLFHLLAGIVGLSLIIVIWQTARIFLKSEKAPLLAALLISLGGGLGWLFFPQFKSADLFMTGFTFISHFQRAHEGLAVIFYLLAFTLFYLGIDRRSFRLNLLSLLCLIILLVFYPFYILSFALIGGIYAFIIYLRQGKAFPLACFFINLAIGGFLALIYTAYLGSSQAFGSVLAQNLPTPGILEITLGYGLLLPFLFYHLRYSQSRGKLFLALWFLINLSLAYLPFGFSRFYLRTLFFPLVLLSLPLIVRLKFLSLLIIASALISSLFIFKMRLEEIPKNNPWYYQSAEEDQALQFLKNAPPGNVLAAYRMGNLIPAKTSKSVYFGHLLQTPGAEEKLNRLYRFYSQKMEKEEARQFLRAERLSYIYWGSEEESIGNDLKYSFLKPVFKEGRVRVLKFSGGF